MLRRVTAHLILASASPRRRELLERIGYLVDVAPSDIEESVAPGEAPDDYVLRLATQKALACADAGRLGWIIAADTTVAVDAHILGKPASPDEAAEMLRVMSGRQHFVHTGYCIAKPNRELLARVVTTAVLFAELSPQDIADYVACGEWDGKAGGYAVQGIAAAFVREVRGSITNVIGLPLAEVRLALLDLGGPRATLPLNP
ncbi:MAG: septum formation protein Maf [Myxococcales bacterium]|nr:septum formation protein Maf [Myxococcales bacterium]